MDLRLPLIAILIAGSLMALAAPLFAPDAQTSLQQTRETGPARADAAFPVIANSPKPATWSRKATLDRQPDGHFYADVSVNGVSSTMLIDTGASTVAITGDDARAMGLQWNPDAVQPVAESASGAVYGVKTRLDRVMLGDLQAVNVRAVIIPEGLPISLLGQSFLSTMASIQVAGDQMVLKN